MKINNKSIVFPLLKVRYVPYITIIDLTKFCNCFFVYFIFENCLIIKLKHLICAGIACQEAESNRKMY